MSPDEVKEDLDALKAEEQADAVEEKEEKFMEEEMKEAGIKQQALLSVQTHNTKLLEALPVERLFLSKEQSIMSDAILGQFRT